MPTGSEARFTMALLSSILGGNMSSRLFQTVREKNGLYYAIYTYTASFLDCGMFGISAAVGRETEQRALALIRDELERFRTDGVTQIGARPRARTGARERAHGGGIHRLAHEQARLF
ncbi:MAG: M16 family metallopeptidase [Oscillospiraceae bacterium]